MEIFRAQRFIRSAIADCSANWRAATKAFWRRLVSGLTNGRPRACSRRRQKVFTSIRQAFPKERAPTDWLRRLFIEEPRNYSLRRYAEEQWDVMFVVQGVAEMILHDVRDGLPARTMRFLIDGDNHRSAGQRWRRYSTGRSARDPHRRLGGCGHDLRHEHLIPTGI